MATLGIYNRHFKGVTQMSFEGQTYVQVWITFDNDAAASAAPARWFRFKMVKDSDLTVYHVATDDRVEDRRYMYIIGINEHWVTNAIKNAIKNRVVSPDVHKFIMSEAACVLKGDRVVLDGDYPCVYNKQSKSETPLCICDEVFVSPICIPVEYCNDITDQNDSERLIETAEKILEAASGDSRLNQILNEKVRKLVGFTRPASPP